MSAGDEVRDAVVALHSAFQDGVDLDEAVVQLFPEEQPQASASKKPPKQSAVDAGPGLSWPALVELDRDHKLCSGEVKAATWERMYRPRMNLLVNLLAKKASSGPKDADALPPVAVPAGGLRQVLAVLRIPSRY